MGNCAISWKSKLQDIIALSSTESEFIALCTTFQEALWLKKLLSIMEIHDKIAYTIFEDNQSCIKFETNNPISHRAKNIDVRYKFIMEHIKNNEINLKYCSTQR